MIAEESSASTARPSTPETAGEGLEHVSGIVARSTRHLVTDPRFAAILEEDFAIPAAAILKALEGEPQKAAIAICEWAARTDGPDRALTNWAKKNRKGSYRPGVRRAAQRALPGEVPAAKLRERNALLARAFLDRFGR